MNFLIQCIVMPIRGSRGDRKVALHAWKRNFHEICENGMLKD